jgi:hypothetical protein
MSNRYKVTTVHGEMETVYHVVDTLAADQPAIVASYGTGKFSSTARKCADMSSDIRNERIAREGNHHD